MNKKTTITILLVAIIAALTIAFFAMNLNTNVNTDGTNMNTDAIQYGTLNVLITDAPVDLSKLEVTIDSIEVLSQNDSWIDLAFIDGVQSVRVDLLALQNITQDLSTTQIPADNYTKIRLHVSDAVATYKDDVTENLKVPSEKIDVIVHFEIQANASTNVLLDMTADSAAISASNNLRPVLKATVVSPTPTPTPEPIPTPSPEPTTEPSPTPTPEATTEPTPTPTP